MWCHCRRYSANQLNRKETEKNYLSFIRNSAIAVAAATATAAELKVVKTGCSFATSIGLSVYRSLMSALSCYVVRLRLH